jgi:hypothetical protein
MDKTTQFYAQITVVFDPEGVNFLPVRGNNWKHLMPCLSTCGIPFGVFQKDGSGADSVDWRKLSTK